MHLQPNAVSLTMESLKIQFPSLMENIRIVESFIENSREKFNIDDDIYGNILVAVSESVNNAIQHGNKLDKNKNVTLSLVPGESEMKFMITDEGPGFDPDSIDDPTKPENLEKPNGRGLYLIRHLSDRVEFSNNGSTIEITFYLS